MRELVIDGRRVADDEPCYVIAEIGHNHGGSLDTARQLIRMASDCGASAAKFQKRDNETLYAQSVLDAPYDGENSFGPTYGAHRAALEFDTNQYLACFEHAKARGLACYATAFDEPSVDFLMALNAPAIKIGSGGLTDHHLLRYAARFGRPIILSTGGGTFADIAAAVDSLSGCPHALLQCTASYPLDAAEADLLVIPALMERYPNTVIGWSSHHPGIALSLGAYVLGARIIEHHVTLNRAGRGTDHAFSLESKGLQTLVEDLEKLRIGFGNGVKTFYESERKPLGKMRRVLTPTGHRIPG